MMSNNRQGIDWRDSLRQLLDPEQQSDVESVGANEPVQAPAEPVFGGRKLDIVLDGEANRPLSSQASTPTTIPKLWLLPHASNNLSAQEAQPAAERF